MKHKILLWLAPALLCGALAVPVSVSISGCVEPQTRAAYEATKRELAETEKYQPTTSEEIIAKSSALNRINEELARLQDRMREQRIDSGVKIANWAVSILQAGSSVFPLGAAVTPIIGIAGSLIAAFQAKRQEAASAKAQPV